MQPISHPSYSIKQITAPFWLVFLLFSQLPADQETFRGQNPIRLFLKEGTKTSVPRKEIMRGGPDVDGIPPLFSPKKVSAKKADSFLDKDDNILGISHNQEAVAYPIRLLNWHEIANDQIGDIPYAITYCPLCRTGIVFDRRLDGETLIIGVSGLLYKSDLIMYDRNSKSLWSQIKGEAIAGPSLGKKLKRIPAIYTTWQEWKNKYPHTLVANFDTGHIRSYNRDPYEGYENSSDIYFPVGNRDPRLHPKKEVFGITHKNSSLAVPLEHLKKKKKIETQLGNFPVTLEYRVGPRAFSKEGKEIPGTVAFWFAWAAFYPDTELIQ